MTAQLLKFPVRLSAAQEAELRARSGEVAAAYAAPLPEGDEGLIEALRRLVEVGDQRSALYDESLSIAVEQIINEITDPPWSRLCDFIENTEPQGPAGVIVKLRYLQMLDLVDGLEGTPDQHSWEGRRANQGIAVLEKAVRS
jgi:hypothetical protein